MSYVIIIIIIIIFVVLLDHSTMFGEGKHAYLRATVVLFVADEMKRRRAFYAAHPVDSK